MQHNIDQTRALSLSCISFAIKEGSALSKINLSHEQSLVINAPPKNPYLYTIFNSYIKFTPKMSIPHIILPAEDTDQIRSFHQQVSTHSIISDIFDRKRENQPGFHPFHKHASNGGSSAR